MTSLHLSASAADHVAAYLEYRNIVGDDDNGQLFTDREYAEYKDTVADARLNHRLYTSWRNTQLSLDCRQIGPSSQCFCTHRYRQHATDNWEKRDVHCKVAGCECRLFEYIPLRGSQEARCHCKHAHDQHSARNKRCRHSKLQPQQKALMASGEDRSADAPPKSLLSTAVSVVARRPTSSNSSITPPKRPVSSATSLIPKPVRTSRTPASSASPSCECDGFVSSNSCSCGYLWSQHSTVFESKEERAAQGRPVDRYDGTMYQAMGGITGFTSLVDGVDKLGLDEAKNVRRPRLAPSAGGRLMIEDRQESQLSDGKVHVARQRDRGVAGSGVSAAESIVAGDERKERELRRGKMGELDEMALYEGKYKKSMSVRSRTGLRPVAPQRVEDDSTRFGSGTPRRSSFNTSMTPSSASRQASTSSASATGAVTALSSSSRLSSGRSSAAASPGSSPTSSASSTPRRSGVRKPAVPTQGGRRGSATPPVIRDQK